MKKRFLGYLILSQLAILAAIGCAPTGEDFGSTTTTSSTTTTTLHTNDVLFVYTPSFDSYMGHAATGVYVCGSFNGWSLSNLPMTWNTDSNRYELSMSLVDGSYVYKYRVQFEAGFSDEMLVKHLCYPDREHSSIWFVDKRISTYANNDFGELDTRLVLPYTLPAGHDVSGSVSNFEPGNVELWAVSGYNWQIVDLIQVSNNSDYTFASLAWTGNIAVSYHNHAPLTNADLNTFYEICVRYGGGTTNALVNLGNIEYDNNTLSPSGYNELPANDIDFYWSLPTSMSGITGIYLHIFLTNSEPGWSGTTVPLSASATNYHFSGSSSVPAGNLYLWCVEFDTASGWAQSMRGMMRLTN